MMQLDKLTLGRISKELGFVRDTLEKTYRLVDVLRYFESDELLADAIALKGGTAINLTIFDLPRLSVDIDLDYCQSINREVMLADREIISKKISKYMIANGYVLSSKSKTYHALDSFVYEYINAGGVKDNLKIEINYMLRCHVLPIEKREVASFMAETLNASDSEKMFWKNFSEGKYMPDLIFAEDIDNLEKHPMALWKCRNIQQQNSLN